uniref:RRP15-like protein n=1 Tax=Anthurium amnicola TaxID=1678845 RepID=A0A1D1XWP4_9ARAE
MELQERMRIPKKRKLEPRKISNPKDAKTKRSGDFKSRKKVEALRKRRKSMEHDPDADEEEENWGEAASSGDGESDSKDSRGVEEEEGERDDGQEEGSSGSLSEKEGRGEEMRKGAMKFTHGCKAFKVAFTKIMKKSGHADSLLGPILSAHKKLVVKKLAEEEEEHKAKGEAKKERHLAAEKGHVKPASFLDLKEKFLISVATRGVVKLFNAVNKAQNPQKGLDPSRTKDAKELATRRKEAFFSEIKKSTTKVTKSMDNNNDEPGWAPLRDSYMLTSSKLKDWDKMEKSFQLS